MSGNTTFDLPFSPGDSSTRYANALRGGLMSKASFNQLALLYNPPRCQIYRNAAQAIATGVFTNIIWNSSYTNKAGAGPAALWSAGTNPTRITASVDGFYAFEVSGTWAAVAGGTFKYAQLAAPGFVFAASTRPAAGTGNAESMSAVVGLTAGNYVEFGVQHDQGGALNFQVFGTTPYLTARWIAPL